MDGSRMSTRRPWQRSDFWAAWIDGLCNFIIMLLFVVTLYVVHETLGTVALIVMTLAMSLFLIPVLMYNKTWTKEQDALRNQRKRYTVKSSPDDEHGVVIDS